MDKSMIKKKKVFKEVKPIKKEQGPIKKEEETIDQTFSISISNIHSPNLDQTSIIKDSQIFQNSFIGSVKSSIGKMLSQDLDDKNGLLQISEALNSSDDMRNLKKYLKEIYPDAEKITIKSSPKRPEIIFEYSKKEIFYSKSLRDLIKINKSVSNKNSNLIHRVYEKLFYRMPPQFKEIIQLGIQMAEIKRINLGNINKQMLLYYNYINQGFLDEKYFLNFILFDCELFSVEFDQNDIENSCKHMKKEIKIYNAFIKKVEESSNKKDNSDLLSIIDKQQNDSDYQDNYKQTYLNQSKFNCKKQFEKNKTRLDELLHQQLTNFQEEIEEKNQKCEKLRNANNFKNKDEEDEFYALSEEVSLLDSQLENYKEKIIEVEKAISNTIALDLEEKQKIYRNLVKKMIIADRQLKSKLPILGKKRQIFNLLEKSNLIILEGETGSGKSTQLPQILCEYFKILDHKDSRPILITQPRKLATRTLAERVASQMQQKVRGFVDYAATADKQINPQAKIIFKMDYLLLDELTEDRSLSKYSCLVIDQAHERTISIDVILGMIKELLLKRKDFKVIVTSASMDTELIKKYFGKKEFNAKELKVSGRLYPVTTEYIEFNHQNDYAKRIQYVIKNHILIGKSAMLDQLKGHILAFCTGVDQINNLVQRFTSYVDPKVFKVYALHGRISAQEQRDIFKPTLKQLKIIFATRIAETSITIDGVKVVIDPGMDRQAVYDQKTKISSRKLVYISQSSAKQRQGRAGRTSKGFCFRLYSQANMKKYYRINKTPEISNMALDTLVLRLKSLKIQNVVTFPYIEPPEKQALETSIQTLKMIGGLAEDETITNIGRLLIKIPIQPFLARAIVQAILAEHVVRNFLGFIKDHTTIYNFPDKQYNRVKNITQEIVEILCMVVNSSNLFAFSKDSEEIQKIKYKKFSDEEGDFFYLHNIYESFQFQSSKNKKQSRRWVRQQKLNFKILDQARQQIKQIMSIIKITNLSLSDPNTREQIEKIKAKLRGCKSGREVVMCCLIASFCTNICLFSQNPSIGYTHINLKRPIQIHWTSTLSLQGINPKWIICYDMITSDRGVNFCKIAHAVQIDLFQKFVDNYVYCKFQMYNLEKYNPFYQCLTQSMSTAMIRNIKKCYQLKQQKQTLSFFNHVSLHSDQINNQIKFFYDTKIKIQDITSQKVKDLKTNILTKGQDSSFKKYIKDFIEDKNHSMIIPYRHNYISTVFISLFNGFRIEKVQFVNFQAEVTLSTDKKNTYDVMNYLDEYFRDSAKIHSSHHLIKLNFDDEENVNNFKDFIIQANTENLFQTKLEYEIKINQQHKKQKLPTTKIYAHFYLGEKASKNLYMHYGSKQVTERMLQILLDAQSEDRIRIRKIPNQSEKYYKLFYQCKFSKVKKQTGINCFCHDLDQFQLNQILEYLSSKDVFPYDFQKPKKINQFREPDISMAHKTDKDWIAAIKDLFKKDNLKDKDLEIRLMDKSKFNENERNNRRNFEKNLKTEMNAEITTSNKKVLDKVKHELDGKTGVLGCDKIHFRYNYKRNICVINKTIFNSLFSLYNSRKDFLEKTSPFLAIEHFIKGQNNRKQFCFISCRSLKKQDLFEPSEQIKSIFTPFAIRLTQLQYDFLENTKQGQNILNYIEEQYNFQIRFDFSSAKSCILKLYCSEIQEAQITSILQSQFKKIDMFSIFVCYRNKNLNKIIKCIQDYQESIEKLKKKHLFLNFKVIFRTREIRINGDKKSTTEINIIINNISKTENTNDNCELCNQKIQKPYKLLNCSDVFCEKCLGKYVNEQKKVMKSNKNEKDDENEDNDEIALILCPKQECNSEMNIYDIKELLNEDEFQAFTYLKVKQFVQSNQEYQKCLTRYCPQIFQIDQDLDSHECILCGKWYCIKCKQSHQNYTCQEWRAKLKSGALVKFGFKSCPHGHGVQKMTKNNVIYCSICKSYYCWNCMEKDFDSHKDCSEHTRGCDRKKSARK